jgi:hypothetical protein
MQARAMALMAQKLEASLALEGQFSVEGLAAMSADGGSLTMELAKSLVENLDFGDMDRIWGHRGAEQSKPCDALPEDGGSSCLRKGDFQAALLFAPGKRREQRLLF